MPSFRDFLTGRNLALSSLVAVLAVLVVRRLSSGGGGGGGSSGQPKSKPSSVQAPAGSDDTDSSVPVFGGGSSSHPTPLVIAIGGGSGSGKTNVVKHLSNGLKEMGVGPVNILLQDNYYKDLSHLSIEERAQSNFDHPNSLDFGMFRQHLELLSRGETIYRPLYSFKTHTRITVGNPEDPVPERKGKTPPKGMHPDGVLSARYVADQLTPGPVIIVDGILALHDPDACKSYDLRVFVDAKEEYRLARRTLRDMSTRGRTRESVLEQFTTTVAPMHNKFVEPTKERADLVLTCEFDTSTEVGPYVRERLVTKVASMLKERGVSVGEMESGDRKDSLSSNL